MASSNTTELSPLAATFELRFRRAWSLCYEDKREEAGSQAAELLLEPRLGPFHQAGMHLLLSMSPSNYLEHAREAVRLYTEIGTRPNMTDVEKEYLGKLLTDANNMLNIARQDQTRIDREVQWILASGMTMDEFHDRRIDDMHKRLDAEEADEAESEVPGGDGEGSRDAFSMTKDSQMARTDSQRTESQTAEPQASGSQATATYSKFNLSGLIADDEPLPDIVRYKFDEKMDI